jgi:hypothetical protein
MAQTEILALLIDSAHEPTDAGRARALTPRRHREPKSRPCSTTALAHAGPQMLGGRLSCIGVGAGSALARIGSHGELGATETSTTAIRPPELPSPTGLAERSARPSVPACRRPAAFNASRRRLVGAIRTMCPLRR